MRKALALFALLLTASVLVACGDDDDDGATAPESSAKGAAEAESPAAGGGGATIKLSADPDGALAFDTDQLDAEAGSVTIDFSNPAAIGHDVAVEDSSGSELGKTEVITESEAQLELSDLKPGEYTYFCSVPGHREGGMEGTLTVK